MKKKKGQYFRCEMCDAEFYRSLGRLKPGSNPRFCSRPCHMKAVTEKRVDRTGPRPHRLRGRSLECAICGSSFYRKASEIKLGANKTCSVTCRNLWLSGERNHFHGQFPEIPPRPRQWTAKQRAEWLAPACVRCGSADRLELDHIVPRGPHTRKNTQTLCRGCNQRKCWYEDRLHYRQIPQGGLVDS